MPPHPATFAAVSPATRRPARAGPGQPDPRCPSRAGSAAARMSAQPAGSPRSPRGPGRTPAPARNPLRTAARRRAGAGWLGAGGDGEHLVGDVRPGGQHVRPAMSATCTKSHGLQAVTRIRAARPAAIRSIQRISTSVLEAVYVHPRAIHVEVPQGDVVQPVHGMEAAQHALVERLRRAVERVVVVRVVRSPVGNCSARP